MNEQKIQGDRLRACQSEHARQSEATPDDYEWALDRVTKMCAGALIDAQVYRQKLLKGFGYPNETFSRAQDYQALGIVLERLRGVDGGASTLANQQSAEIQRAEARLWEAFEAGFQWCASGTDKYGDYNGGPVEDGFSDWLRARADAQEPQRKDGV